jgi:hypothetical protein
MRTATIFPNDFAALLFCAMATCHALAALVLWKMASPETVKKQKDVEKN